MYNLEHLKMLVTTVETGSFSSCARKLGKVQSAVSQGIANLEIDLDLELFNRSTRKPTLTADGARILDFARSILLQIDDINAAAQAMHKGEEALIRIALDNALLLPNLISSCHKFSIQFPSTTLEIITLASPDIGRAIFTGRADIGIMFSEVEIDARFNQCFIGNLPFFTVCSPHHSLAKLEEVSMGDLIPHRQLMLRGEIGSGLDHFPKMSTHVWWANNFHTIRDMVINGLGWAYLPEHYCQDLLTHGKIHRLHLAIDHKTWSPPVELRTSKNTPIGPAMRWLFENLKNLF